MTELAHAVSREEQLEELARDLVRYRSDPMGYTMWSWDWGSTPELRLVKLPEPWASKYDSEYGPDGWFCELLESLGEAIRERGFDPDHPHHVMPMQFARRSGHGIGKSAGMGMLACFILDTRGGKGVVTANTRQQLRTKTWPQVKLWRSTSICASRWRILDTRIVHVDQETKGDGERYGVLDASTWDPAHTEAFAGQHDAAGCSWYMFDEASAVHDEIWRVSRGGLTDGEPFWFVFGNPTKNVGEFSNCFKRNKAKWDTAEIDSRTVQITNKELFDDWIETYGIDSDFVRVRVLGKEPRQGENQLIPSNLVAAAMRRDTFAARKDDPIVMGIDVARSPLGDESVIFVRRGKDARTYGMKIYRGKDTHQLASIAAEWCTDLDARGHPVSIIFVDGGGVGAGTYDRLNRLGYPVISVNFGGEADRPDRYRFKDAEMWDRAKAWLNDGGFLLHDETLAEQLAGRPYEWTDTMRMFLWPKKVCRKELGIGSPDRADAFALTFAFPVESRTLRDFRQSERCVTADRHDMGDDLDDDFDDDKDCRT